MVDFDSKYNDPLKHYKNKLFNPHPILVAGQKSQTGVCFLGVCFPVNKKTQQNQANQ